LPLERLLWFAPAAGCGAASLEPFKASRCSAFGTEFFSTCDRHGAPAGFAPLIVVVVGIVDRWLGALENETAAVRASTARA
jgi:hypothetical protein